MDENVLIPFNMPSSVPVPSRSDRADFIDKIKPEQIVEIIRHRLLGEEWINGKWEKISQLQQYALTDVGAWDIANLMLGVATINVSISKLKDFEIKRRLKRIARTAQIKLLSNWIEYGLRNTGQQDFIHEIVFTNTLVVLKQADEASIQELMKATVTENRNVNTEKKEKMGDRIKRMLGA